MLVSYYGGGIYRRNSIVHKKMNGLNNPSLHRRDTITKGDFLIMLVTIVMNFHSLVVRFVSSILFCFWKN